jgi:hypothetical protein
LIYRTKLPSFLFVGRENYAMCQRCLAELEQSLMKHDKVKLFKIDYTELQGLLPNDPA